MRALITGITGQDGSYLAEHLLKLGYEVHGLYRRTSGDSLGRIHHILDKVKLHRGDLCDHSSLLRTLRHVKPDELYNLADQDNVDWSYETPSYSSTVTGAAVSVLLEAIKHSDIRMFQAISATMFGNAPTPQTLATPLNPLSPYACAKAYAWHLCKYHRQCYGTHVACGVMYNHDSPRRGNEYLLHRMVQSEVMEFDNPEQIVEIGFAGDFAASMQRAIRESGDYMFGGWKYTIQEWAHMAGCGVRLAKKPYRPGPKCNLLSYESAPFHAHPTSGAQLVEMLKEKYHGK